MLTIYPPKGINISISFVQESTFKKSRWAAPLLVHETLSRIEKNRNNLHTYTWVMECTTLNICSWTKSKILSIRLKNKVYIWTNVKTYPAHSIKYNNKTWWYSNICLHRQKFWYQTIHSSERVKLWTTSVFIHYFCIIWTIYNDNL